MPSTTLATARRLPKHCPTTRVDARVGTVISREPKARVETIEEYVARIVADAPPLTHDQWHEIQMLLGGAK
jgi:hypothetical protein